MGTGFPILVAYAKPTPVDPARLKKPQRDFSLVAVAGPLGNLAAALGLALVGAVAFRYFGAESSEARLLVGAGIECNLALAWLNLMPLPGFDGLKALYAFLPGEWCWRLHRAERFHLYLLVLIVSVWMLMPDQESLGAFYYPLVRPAKALMAFAGTELPVH